MKYFKTYEAYRYGVNGVGSLKNSLAALKRQNITGRYVDPEILAQGIRNEYEAITGEKYEDEVQMSMDNTIADIIGHYKLDGPDFMAAWDKVVRESVVNEKETLASAIEKEMDNNRFNVDVEFFTRDLRQIQNTKNHKDLHPSIKKVLKALKKKYRIRESVNEARGGQIFPGDYVKNQHGNVYLRVDGKVGRHDAYVRVTNGKAGKRKTGLHDSFKLTLVNKDGLEESVNEGSDQARLTHLRKFGIAPNNQPQNAAYIKQVSKPGKFFVDWKDAFKLGDVALEFVKSTGSISEFDIIDLKTMKRTGKQLDVKKGQLGNLRTTYGVRVNESVNEAFIDIKNKIIEDEIEIAKKEDFPNLKNYLKRIEKMKTIDNPKKFITAYKRLTGATKWDLPDELVQYESNVVNEKETLASAIEKEMDNNRFNVDVEFFTRDLRQIQNTKNHKDLHPSIKKVLKALKKKYRIRESVNEANESVNEQAYKGKFSIAGIPFKAIVVAKGGSDYNVNLFLEEPDYRDVKNAYKELIKVEKRFFGSKYRLGGGFSPAGDQISSATYPKRDCNRFAEHLLTLKESVNEEKDFEPHMMYDPKTGKGYKAEKQEDHDRMDKLGYVHEKPEEVTESYKGNFTDFKYDLEMAIDNMDLSPKSIKSVKKTGNGYEVKLSSYMNDKSTWEKIGDAIGAKLISFKPGSTNVGIYE